MDAKFTNIINGAPDALNTLKELSDALGADANFSGTIVNQLGGKTDKSTTNNSATAWSSGLASDAYHYINTGSDAGSYGHPVEKFQRTWWACL